MAFFWGVVVFLLEKTNPYSVVAKSDALLVFNGNHVVHEFLVVFNCFRVFFFIFKRQSQVEKQLKLVVVCSLNEIGLHLDHNVFLIEIVQNLFIEGEILKSWQKIRFLLKTEYVGNGKLHLLCKNALVLEKRIFHFFCQKYRLRNENRFFSLLFQLQILGLSIHFLFLQHYFIHVLLTIFFGDIL